MRPLPACLFALLFAAVPAVHAQGPGTSVTLQDGGVVVSGPPPALFPFLSEAATGDEDSTEALVPLPAPQQGFFRLRYR